MFTVFNRKTLLSMLMPNVKCLENGQLVAHLYNLGRHRAYNSVEHTNAKCHVLNSRFNSEHIGRAYVVT